MSHPAEDWFATLVKTMSIHPSESSRPDDFEELRQQCLALERSNPIGSSIVFMVDYTTMKYHYISPLFCDFTGADPARLYQETVDYGLSFVHPLYTGRFAEAVYPEMFDFFFNITEFTGQHHRYRASYNYTLRHKNGNYYPFVQRVIPLSVSRDGKLLLDMGVVSPDNSFADENKIVLCVDRMDDQNIYHTVLRKEYWIINNEAGQLSGREMQIADLIRNGLSSREISDQLHLSEHTVKNHKRKIFAKAGVKKVTELIRWLKKK